MSVQLTGDGRRLIESEVQVAGSAQAVWTAIATSGGISAWFVPSTVEERVGGQIVCNFGPGMDAIAEVTEWSPPQRFRAIGEPIAPDSPPLITEWVVEPGDANTCTVRVVHSLTADDGTWDKALESTAAGWPWFFRVLQIYLRHFESQPSEMIRAVGFAPGSAPKAWAQFAAALDLRNPVQGARCSTAGSRAPTIAGTVEETGFGSHPDGLIVRTDTPGPGIASIVAQSMGKKTVISFNFFIYGPNAAAIAPKEDTAWNRWVEAHIAASKW